MRRHGNRHRVGMAVVIVTCLTLVGCGGQARQPQAGAASAPASGPQPATRAMREQLLAGMVSILDALDRYDEARAGEQVFDRLVQWQHAAGQGSGTPPRPCHSTRSRPRRSPRAGRSWIAPGSTFPAT